MSIWEKLKDGTKAFSEKSEEIIEVARSKSEELVGITKQRMAVSKVQTEIIKKKTELGSLVYDLSCKRREDSESVDSICDEIKALELELSKLENAMMDAKNQSGPVCPNCSAKASEGAKYCSNCGSPLSEIKQDKPEE